ncbi:MAG: tetratricopeptide repeat protein [Proteobacteria bacterium]|nr:tetratricopeptide repeat protein [Pseudomonadota bacterium]
MLAHSFDVVESLDSVHRQAALDLADNLGATAIPLCIRELAKHGRDTTGPSSAASRGFETGRVAESRVADPDPRVQWAGIILRHLSGVKAVRDRVVAALGKLAESSSSLAAARARSALADIQHRSGAHRADCASEPTTIVHGPDHLADGVDGPSAKEARIYRDSMLAELAELWNSAAGIALAGHFLVNRLSCGEIPAVVDALGIRDPARTLVLIDELLLRTDVDETARGQLKRIRAALRAHIGRHVKTPLPGGQCVATAYVGDHPSGQTVVIATRRVANAAGHRVLSLLICSDTKLDTNLPVNPPDARREDIKLEETILVDGLYRDELGPRAVDREILAPIRQQGYRLVPHSAKDVRALVIHAARNTLERRFALPGAFYLGRDLLGIYDQYAVISGVHLSRGVAGTNRQQAGVPSRPADFGSGEFALHDCSPEESGYLLDRALSLLAVGKARRARPLFEFLLARDPDNADARAAFARCLLVIDDVAGAKKQLNRAIWLQPDNGSHHWNIAAIAHAEGRAGSCYLALMDYLAVTGSVDVGGDDGASGDPAERRELALGFVAEYRRIAHLEHPEARVESVAHVDELVFRAKTHMRAHRYGPAIAVLEEACFQVPSHYRAWTQLGLAYLGDNRPHEARQCFRRALDANPGHSTAVEALVESGIGEAPPQSSEMT